MMEGMVSTRCRPMPHKFFYVVMFLLFINLMFLFYRLCAVSLKLSCVVIDGACDDSRSHLIEVGEKFGPQSGRLLRSDFSGVQTSLHPVENLCPYSL